MNQFQGFAPTKEGCDPETCTDAVGGEHGPKCQAPYDPELHGPLTSDELDFAPGELTELWGK